MARKFNIGDTVEVVSGPALGFSVGHSGKVLGYCFDKFYPYLIQRQNGNKGRFYARELKLIKRKTKTKNKNKGD